MLTFLFWIFMFIIFGKILIFSIKAAWGISRMVVTLILLPLFLVGLVLKGLLVFAGPLLIIIGILSLVCLHD